MYSERIACGNEMNESKKEEWAWHRPRSPLQALRRSPAPLPRDARLVDALFQEDVHLCGGPFRLMDGMDRSINRSPPRSALKMSLAYALRVFVLFCSVLIL